MYFAIPSDQPDPVLSNHSARCILLCHFSNLALEQPWANEELRLLLKELREQRQPIPAVLTAWAYRNVTYPEETASRGRHPEARRNVIIAITADVLRARGHRQKDINAFVGRKLNLEMNTVKSALQKGRVMRKRAQLRIFP